VRAPSSAVGLRLPTGASAGSPIRWCSLFSEFVVVFLTGLVLREGPSKLAIAGGKSFWSLVLFTMQMVMIMIGGYVVASTPLVHRAIPWLAGEPKTPRSAVALLTLFSMLTSLIWWGQSLTFSGRYVRELSLRGKRPGLPSRRSCSLSRPRSAVWSMGLSFSSGMLMATKSSIPPSLFDISGRDHSHPDAVSVAAHCDHRCPDCRLGGGGGLSIRAVREKTPELRRTTVLSFGPSRARWRREPSRESGWNSPGLNILVAALLGW